MASDDARSSRYAITVAFALHPEMLVPFLDLVRANAAASLGREPECLRFDVLVPLVPQETDVLLYEIYVSRAAFDAHLASDHFLAFDEATRAMVVRKTVVEYATRETVAGR